MFPSLIDSQERYEFAEVSFKSLTAHLPKSVLQIFIVDESPIDWKQSVIELYSDERVKLLHGCSNNGSAAALKLAVDEAKRHKFKLGYIHLDDHIYTELFSTLVPDGACQMNQDESIKFLRFSGYPLIHSEMEPLKTSGDWMLIDEVKFKKIKTECNNLWLANLSDSFCNDASDYWTVTLWHCLYDLEFLSDILTFGSSFFLSKTSIKRKALKQKIHLAHIELYFRNFRLFEKLIAKWPQSKFGYVNFQFVGFEMHRNANWEDLLRSENRKL